MIFINNKGFSLIELIIVAFILSLVIAISLPSFWKFYLATCLKHQTLYFYSKMKIIRYDAISNHVSIGMVFYNVENEWYYIKVKDGNNNGIRLKDIQNGIDLIIEGPWIVSQEKGINIGILSSNVPKIPPEKGYIDKKHPIQFGKSNIFACSSSGTCTPGTIYFMSKSINCMKAIRVYAPTSKITLWHYCKTSNWHKKI